MILKNTTVLVACLFLLNSCGGEKSENEKEEKDQTDKNKQEKHRAGQNNENKNQDIETFVYEGEMFNTPNCEDVDATEVKMIWKRSIPDDSAGVVKQCGEDGKLKRMAEYANKQRHGKQYNYHTGAGFLSSIETWEKGEHVCTEMFREDKTMMSKTVYVVGSMQKDYTMTSYGIKGEPRRVDVYKNREPVSCEGDCD